MAKSQKCRFLPRSGTMGTFVCNGNFWDPPREVPMSPRPRTGGRDRYPPKPKNDPVLHLFFVTPRNHCIFEVFARGPGKNWFKKSTAFWKFSFGIFYYGRKKSLLPGFLHFRRDPRANLENSTFSGPQEFEGTQKSQKMLEKGFRTSFTTWLHDGTQKSS